MQTWEQYYWVEEARRWGITGIKPADILEDDETYNCIAYMFGITDQWLWPGMYDWPTEDYKPLPQTFDTVLRYNGYVRTERPKRYNKGYEYALLYMDPYTQLISHGARRVGSTWVSKCGRGPLLKHRTPEQLSKCYGKPAYFYRRPLS